MNEAQNKIVNVRIFFLLLLFFNLKVWLLSVNFIDRWQYGVASQNLDTSIKSFQDSSWGRKLWFFWLPLQKEKSVFLACLPDGKFHFYCLPWGRSHEPGTKEDIILSQLSGFQAWSLTQLPSQHSDQRQKNWKQSRADHNTPLFIAFYWALSKTHILPCILKCICNLWPSWPHFPILSALEPCCVHIGSIPPVTRGTVGSAECLDLPCHLTSAL